MTRSEKLDVLRQRLVGRRVQMGEMHGDPDPIPPRAIGTIASIDDAGTLHVSWDSGWSLGLIPSQDEFTILDTEEEVPHVQV